MIMVESAGQTDVGLKRKGNEDSLFIDDDLKLYVVADGMGGHLAGEVASNMVVREIAERIRGYRQNGDSPQEMVENPDKSLSDDANALAASIRMANWSVHKAANAEKSYRGMGSTVSSLFLTAETLIAANVGDSPIYLIRNGEIETLSVTHTVMAEQMAMDDTIDARYSQAYGHMLTRAMGVEDAVEADICELPFFRGDIVVIASDGLTNKVSPVEIKQVVTAKKPSQACRMLIDMANERGGEDNITVVVLKIKQVQSDNRGIMGWISRIFGF